MKRFLYTLLCICVTPLAAFAVSTAYSPAFVLDTQLLGGTQSAISSTFSLDNRTITKTVREGISNSFVIDTLGSAYTSSPAFIFSNVSPQQQPGIPFNVTITAVEGLTKDGRKAVNTNYNGLVNIRTTGAMSQLDKNYVNFVSGLWNGLVTLDAPANGIRITAYDGALFGQCNPFDVFGTGNATIVGRVEQYSSVSGAMEPVTVSMTVKLQRGQVQIQTSLQADGSFAFANLPAGTYDVHAAGSDLNTDTQPVNLVFDAILYQWQFSRNQRVSHCIDRPLRNHKNQLLKSLDNKSTSIQKCKIDYEGLTFCFSNANGVTRLVTMYMSNKINF